MKEKFFGMVVCAVFFFFSCGGGENLSFTNPDWRNSVPSRVEFPLPEPVTLRVGLGQDAQDSDTVSIEWLEEQTNISLEFEGLITSPGDVLLGEMMREGRLPDIMPEGRLSISEMSIREILVDFLEFPSLTPNFLAYTGKNKDFKNSVLARTTNENRLYSLGSYDPDRLTRDGVIAYRRDLFEKHGLGYETWDEVLASLRYLKKEYPESYPLGGSFSDLLTHLPTWFGSGYDPDNLVYYDMEEKKWKMGIFEEEFRESIRVLAELAGEEIILPDAFSAGSIDISRFFAQDVIFLAPYTAMTGPAFVFAGEEGYGSLNEDGEWDGSGRWIDAMPIPKRKGESVPYSSKMHNIVGSGWQIYNQSPHVGEAIALLDFLFSPEAAIVNDIGIEGMVWEASGDTIKLTERFEEAYQAGWVNGLKEAFSEAGVKIGSPLVGLQFDFLGIFGPPDIARLRYYLDNDMQRSRPGLDLILQPGIRISTHSDFRGDRAPLYVSLETTIESGVANIVGGRSSMDDFDAIVEKVRKYGGEELVDLYNTWCIPVDPAILGEKR